MKNFDFWLKWGSTFILILAALTNSLNIIPWDRVLGLIGAFGWFVASYRMKEYSLLTINLISVIIYLIGFILIGI